ncbi:glutathione-disulfide reductase [Oscillatoria sp. FACHB-1407]|uniref:glutathione-disulfide reductase n=1 Tax=Oscillatoria sp. FACHB-1407 TaxID=2692847 RepID=UPI001687ABD1|nr:glutathione-disulfide reductase [Oscillatoria sp. FACHB-1407]MBD2460893.1 glutathione-disulfide reductase [Oscillatoria sp. FACHB-1407]
MAYDYDLVVIGAGPGGLSAAKRAAHYGAKVAIAEREALGGVCLNRGCIPKTLMAYASRFQQWIEDARCYGWQVGEAQFHWHQFRQARDQEVDCARQSHTKTLAKAGVDLIPESAVFVDPHTLKLGDRRVTADKLLIAVGGKPIKPDIPGIEHCVTSREMFALEELPKRLVIMGAGYIGVEFSSTFRGYGVEVMLINADDEILSGFDDDLRKAVHNGLTERGVEMWCKTKAKEVEPVTDGLRVTLSGDCPETITADLVLCAIGRTPNLEELQLEQAGVEVQEKAIAVDDQYRTSQSHIFAVGDCTNRVPLTPVARTEGRIFADIHFGNQPGQLQYDLIPSAVFSHPQAAGVGLTEAKAREQYGEEAIACQRIEFQPLLNRLLDHPTSPDLFKIIAEKSSGRVLGVHLVGDQVADLIQGIGLAMHQGVTQHDFETMIGVHPTAAEELFS